MTAARGGARRPVRVAIALGSNLGNRRAHLTWALAQLARAVDGLRASSFVDTAAVEVREAQPRYLNGVAIGHTRLSAHELLAVCLSIEARRGRVRIGDKAPRTLDLDLVLYGDAVIDEPSLRVPHPRFRHRPFVLGPLAALAPRWRDPETGRTLAALWRAHRLPGRGKTAGTLARRDVAPLSGPRARRGPRGAGTR